MKKLTFLTILLFLFSAVSGCGQAASVDIAATTLPVYEFTTAICRNTPIQIGRLINENVSCLHDYTLQTSQMRVLESADALVISGAGLEDFLEDVPDAGKTVIDASAGTHLHDGHGHSHGESEAHAHEEDPHFWLSPENARIMAENIYHGLCRIYPAYTDTFDRNLQELLLQLDALQSYGDTQLSGLSNRRLITFHDGFSYFAESFQLEILMAVEEESGSEASAAELKDLILLVEEYHLPGIFVERNGSVSAADIICAETDVRVFALDMAMSGDSYFDAMYHNIDTVKEALE